MARADVKPHAARSRGSSLEEAAASSFIQSEDIVGFKLCRQSARELTEEVIRHHLSDRRPFVVSCLNPHSAVQARSDPEAAAALRGSDVLLPDGIGVVVASILLGGSIRRRVTGMDFFLTLSDALNREGTHRCYFLGAGERTLSLLSHRYRSQFPAVTIAGTYSPPFAPAFSEEQNTGMVRRINEAEVDVLWVGMTAPKQEKWIYANSERLRVGLIAPIGAAFDFYAGSVPRPGPYTRALGLEWLFRLMREPGRLWRRTFVSAPSFLTSVVRQRLAR